MSPGLQTQASSGEIGHTSTSRKLVCIPLQYCLLALPVLSANASQHCLPHTFLFHPLARLFVALKLGIAVSTGYMTEQRVLSLSTALHGHLQPPFL